MWSPSLFYPTLPIFLHRFICHICDILQLCQKHAKILSFGSSYDVQLHVMPSLFFIDRLSALQVFIAKGSCLWQYDISYRRCNFFDPPHKLYCKISKLLSISVAFVGEFLWIIDQTGSFYCTTQALGHEFLSPTASEAQIASWIDNYGQGSVYPFNASLLAVFMTLGG